MKKSGDLKVMIKETVIIFVITLLAGIMLGYVHELTKDPIAKQKEKEVQEACKAVFSNAERFDVLKEGVSETLSASLLENGVKIGTIYTAKNGNDETLGYVVESTSSRGYGGNIVLYLGITKDGVLNDISILEISETPGLGMRAQDVLVPQFHDQAVDHFEYTKTGKTAENEIDAISGATITTKAVTNAVNGGLEAVAEIQNSNEQGGASNE